MDNIASYISGKFAIGKIDCTAQTALCKDPKFKVNGYPTLTIYKDGNFYEYSGRRDADSIITFMEKMSQPSVTLVESQQEFVNEVLDKSGDGVAFLAFDSKAKQLQIQTSDSGVNRAEVTAVEKYISSTKFLQIYGQTSRVLQSSSSSFALLHPTKFAEFAKFEDLPSSLLKKNQPLLLRIEKGAKPMLYTGDSLSSESVIDWIKKNVLPLVINLEGHNFKTVRDLGKLLVIGVINPELPGQKEKEGIFYKELLDLAQDGPMDIINKYKFTQMNAKKFHSFLAQFNISSHSRIPQAIVVNVQNRTFYQNETYTSVHEFLDGVESGEIEEQIEGDNSGKGIYERFKFWFVSNLPMSALMMVVSVLVILMSISIFSDDGDDEATKMEIKRELMTTKRFGDKEKVKRKTMKED